MSKVAAKNKIALSVCSSVEEFGQLPSHRQFDVAIIDYFLGDITGLEIASLFR